MTSIIQLEYIVAVAKYQSFSKAAEHCFVTQPTLSMQIKKMEDDLDVILFDRTKKPVTPTEVGEAVIEQAKIILSETDKIDEIIQFSKKTLSGKMTLGIIPSIAPYLLPNFIGRFAKKYPDLEIFIKEMLSDELMDAIDAGDLDMGILATPLPRDGFKITPLYYEKILLYCNKNHDFAVLSQVDINTMRDQKIWLMSNGNCFRNQAVNLCELQEDKDQSGFSYESASIETLVKLVDKEGGITLIPELVSNNLTAKRKENIKPFKNITPLREVSLITSRIFIKKRMREALVEAIQSNLPSEMLKNNEGEIVEWANAK